MGAFPQTLRDTSIPLVRSKGSPRTNGVIKGRSNRATFFQRFLSFFFPRTGKTRNISKVWKINRGQNIWIIKLRIPTFGKRKTTEKYGTTKKNARKKKKNAKKKKKKKRKLKYNLKKTRKRKKTTKTKK